MGLVGGDGIFNADEDFSWILKAESNWRKPRRNLAFRVFDDVKGRQEVGCSGLLTPVKAARVVGAKSF